MGNERNMQLLNLSTGEIIALLTEAQVQELQTQLERESIMDTSFFITPETIEFLRARGANELAVLLAAALGPTESVIVGYAPISTSGSARVQGRLLSLESNTPLTGYKIEVYDEDIAFDDLLGWCYSDPEGKFELRFEESAFKDVAMLDIAGEPEVKLRILDTDGAEVGWVGLLRETELDFGDIFVSAAGKLIAPILDPTAGAICPDCGALYRAGFSLCSDDQIPLRSLA